MKEDDEYIKGNKRTRCEIYSRIVGYFRPLSNWNKGKKQEYKDRRSFKIENRHANKK